MEKIIGIYRITNTITGDFYIGSSKDIKLRLACHKCPSTWNEHPNNPLYLDMKKYGLNKFSFQILAEVEIEQLKEKEQQFIEMMKPTYNQMNAKGLNIEKRKEYEKTNKRKQYHKEYDNQLCYYNGKTMTLGALRKRLKRKGIEHPQIEAKKYLVL